MQMCRKTLQLLQCLMSSPTPRAGYSTPPPPQPGLATSNYSSQSHCQQTRSGHIHRISTKICWIHRCHRSKLRTGQVLSQLLVQSNGSDILAKSEEEKKLRAQWCATTITKGTYTIGWVDVHFFQKVYFFTKIDTTE